MSSKSWTQSDETKQISAEKRAKTNEGKIDYYHAESDTVKSFIKDTQPEGWVPGRRKGVKHQPISDAQKKQIGSVHSSKQEVTMLDGTVLEFDSNKSFIDHFGINSNHIYKGNIEENLLKYYNIIKLVKHKKNGSKK